MGLTHYIVDAVLVSAIVSGAKRSGAFEFKTKTIENETLRSVVENYLFIGDWIVDTTAQQLPRQFPTWIDKK